MIITKLQGGLGNQMFQYALCRKLSLSHKTNLKLDTASLNLNDPLIVKRSYSLSIFNIKTPTASPEEISQFLAPQNLISKITLLFKKNKRYITEPTQVFSPAILKLPDNIYLDGYWQSPKYFSDIRDVLKKDFSLADPIPQKVLDLSEKITNCESVCINVRRGDFVTHPRNSKFHGFCDMTYFDKAIEKINSEIENPKFFIFSDDLKWCEDNLKLKYGGTIVGHNLAGPHFSWYLYLLSQCKHQIIPNSSFGWWGAWLNDNPNKIVIVPKKWINPEENTSDRYCDDWLVI